MATNRSRVDGDCRGWRAAERGEYRARRMSLMIAVDAALPPHPDLSQRCNKNLSYVFSFINPFNASCSKLLLFEGFGIFNF